MENKVISSVENLRYTFWTPPEGRVVEVGPEQRKVALPAIPLPVHREDLEGGEPSDDALGRGIYDYLRQFPDCPHNTAYAEILRDAYSHYLADIGSQAAMLAYKDVDAAYVQRKITCMKILALLEPDNPGLLQQIGMAQYDMAVTYSELGRTRRHLLNALGFLQRSLKFRPDDPVSLNYLGQIDFLLGDYPSAARRWGGVVAALEDGPARQALAAKLARIDAMDVPDHPLVDDLEAIGTALEACGAGDFQEAGMILEILEEKGTITAEMPSPEFFYLLGVCRVRNGDSGGAFESFEKALELDPEYQPALEGKEAVLDGRAL